MSAGSSRKRARALSELEGCVLGHLCKHGPCTPYAVRRAFFVSPSSHWSGSAGAVYPVLARLEKLALVESVHTPRGGRDAWLYAPTRAGKRRFRVWLEPPFLPDIVSVPPDPLRTRLSFFGTLSGARRERFVARAIEALRHRIEAVAARVEDDDDERLAQACAQHAMRARLSWFESLSRPARRRRARRSVDRARLRARDGALGNTRIPTGA